MCGIAGYNGKEIEGLMPRMLDRIRHRGPDDSGEFADENVHLGMVRLSIIDLSGGHQPITNEDGTIWVIFNGEIFNYIELRAELEAKGHQFRTNSDTETIVHGYEEYGTKFAHKLNGMFTIAIWDTRVRTLFLYRDRYGVKPLFYSAQEDGTLVFGSEIKSVRCHPAVGRELDYEALSHYLSLRNVPAPYTIFKEIRALLPGEMLEWNEERGVRVSRWYELPTAVRWNDGDEDSLVERIDELLRDAVRLRLRSDVKYGAYLSGGIDSSTVVAITSEYSSPVKTFTLSFADSPEHKRDSYFARQVAERYATEHHECVMSWTDLRDELLTVTRHLDQPFAGVTSSYWLSRFMKRYVTVALSGDGADDMFGSYGHHRLVWPIAEMRRAYERGRSLKDVDLSFFVGREDFVTNLAQYRPWEWRLAYGAFMQHEKERLLTARGRELLMPHSTTDFLKSIYERCDSSADELNKMLYLDVNTLLPNEILYFNDMLSMAHSMEVRTPFLDYRLAELACSIPGTLKIRNGKLKYILRRVAARYVPQEILDRPKEGFVLPKNTWMRAGMSGVVTEVLSEERLALHGFFERGYIASLVADFMKGDDALTFKIWTLIIFQLWYEDYLSA